jgi:hypothetical protein
MSAIFADMSPTFPAKIGVSPLEEHHALKDVTLEVTEKIFPRGKGRVEHRMLLKDFMLILHLI